MITREQAIKLGSGWPYMGYLHKGDCLNRGRVYLWRTNGKVQTWKWSPERFRVPLKHGLYDYGALTQDNASEFHLVEDCPLFLLNAQGKAAPKEE